MTKKQMIAIISLAVATLVLAGVVIGVVTSDDGTTDAESSPTTASNTSAAATTEEEAVEDPAAVLAAAEVNSIHPAPAPEAVEEWGDYALSDSWDGRVRVFEDSEPNEISAPGGERFPATMNNCGIAMYYVTFRSVNENVDIEAHLINAIGESAASRALNQGWSLSTNCETPAFEFISASDISTLGDVVYDVHEYRQSSVAPAAPPEPAAAPVTSTPPPTTAPAPTTAAPEPTLVQCMGYLGPPIGLYSDGVERPTPGCANSPEQQRSARAEGVCGGLGGWTEVSEAEYIDLCGIAPPTHLAPSSTSTPDPTEYYDPYERNEPYGYQEHDLY
jgi:hypothetical protein